MKNGITKTTKPQMLDLFIINQGLQCRPVRRLRRWCLDSLGLVFAVGCIITLLVWMANDALHNRPPKEDLPRPRMMTLTKASNEAAHSARKIKKYIYSAPRAIGVLESVRFADDLAGSPPKNPEFNFLISSATCRNRTDILVFVHSSPGHRSDRSQIRNTWGSVQSLKGFNIRLVFILGLTGSRDLQRSIESESLLFGDIVQANFIDHSKNLTYKHLTAFNWILQQCPDVPYVLKINDNTLVDIFHLIEFLQGLEPNTKDFLYCSAFLNQPPRRDKFDRWFVSYEDYPDERYPTYCEGFGYITTVKTVKTLYEVSKHTPVYWVDDVYITGILAHKGGIVHTDMDNKHCYTLMTDDFNPDDLKHYIFILAKYSHHKIHWNKIWKNIKILHNVF